MIHVYLCDDNPAVLETYSPILRKIADKYSFGIHILTFRSAEELLFHYEEVADPPDIIFMDIIMGKGNGLDAARKLRTMQCPSEIIFLTGNPEFVFDSFDVAPANFIIKSQISDHKFEEIFLKAVATSDQKSKAVFYCENGGIKKSIPVSSISHFEVVNRIVTVYYDKNTFDFYSTLDEVSKKLDTFAFLRVHRSYLVNIHSIEQLNRNDIILSTGEIIPMGVTHTKKVKEDLNHYFRLFH